MKRAGSLVPAQVSTGVGVSKTLRLEVDAPRALCVFRAVFRWSAAAYLSCFHLRIRRGGVGQFHLFLFVFFFFPWRTRVLRRWRLCVC